MGQGPREGWVHELRLAPGPSIGALTAGAAPLATEGVKGAEWHSRDCVILLMLERPPPAGQYCIIYSSRERG